MEFLLIWLACGAISAIVAAGKNRSAAGWFFGGVMLGPLGIVLALVLPSIPEESD